MQKNQIKSNWDLSQLGKGVSDQKFKKERADTKKAYEAFASKWSKDNTYLTDVKNLKKSLQEYEALHLLSDNEAYYLGLSEALDNTDKKLKAANKKFEEYYKPLGNLLTFYVLSLGKINAKNQARFLKDKNFEQYWFFLSEIFKNAKHYLSEKEENLLSLLAGVSGGNWQEMREEFLSKEEEESVVVKAVKGKKKYSNKKHTFEELMNLLDDKDKKVRDSAAKGVNTIVSRQLDVTEKEINSVLEKKKITDKLRGYTRPDQARHIADDINSKTVDVMIKEVTGNFSIAKDYYKLKAKLLKKNTLAYHERNMSYGKLKESFSYEKAIGLVERTYDKLDQEFADSFRMFVKEGRIDAMPKKGKSGGAFCVGAGKTTSTYILLNHGDTLNNVLTIAHEAGHGMHNEQMRPVQPPFYCGTSLATAEVASTFCEDFVLKELLEKASKEERLTILMEKLNSDISTIFRQVAFYNFETELHKEFREKGYLPTSDIGVIFQKHMKTYMGSAVSHEKGTENWWAYVGHFRSPFYVYTYASGLLISKALQAMVSKNKTNIEKVKTFMRAGASNTAENIFKEAGVNIENKQFWQEGIGEIRNLLKETKKLAKELGKI